MKFLLNPAMLLLSLSLAYSTSTAQAIRGADIGYDLAAQRRLESIESYKTTHSGDCLAYKISAQDERRLGMRWIQIGRLSKVHRGREEISISLQDDPRYYPELNIDGQNIQFYVKYKEWFIDQYKGDSSFAVTMKNYNTNPRQKQNFHQFKVNWEVGGQVLRSYWINSDWGCEARTNIMGTDSSKQGEFVIYQLK
jgi:hypothetical protein